MKYVLPALTGANAAIAARPRLNVETRLKVSKEPILQVAEIEQTGLGTTVALTAVALTSGDPTVTHASATGFAVGDIVTGTGIPDGARVLTITTPGTVFELDVNASATVAGGTATVETAAAATLEADATYEEPAAGYDLQIALLTGMPATVLTRVKVAVVFDDDSTGTAEAVFQQPSYANQNPDGGEAWAQDLTTSDTARQIKSITSLVNVIGGSVGCRFAIWKLPEAWIEPRGTTQKNVDSGGNTGVAVPERYAPVKYLIRGRGTQGMLRLAGRYTTAANGLSRLNGQPVSVMLETWANNTVLVEREICAETFLEIKSARASDGNEETTVTAEAPFAKHAIFVSTL